MKHTFTVDENKVRLDKFLTGKLAGEITRSQVKKLILSGAVLVNGQEPTVHQFLRTDDEVVAELPEKKHKPAITSDDPMLDEIKIISEQEDFIIISKPAGLLVHEGVHAHELTLADYMVYLYPEVADVGDDPKRPGIVHRLDRDVSGLMIIPRSQESFKYFKELFLIRQIDKRYHTLVHGVPEKVQDDIFFEISRSKVEPHKMAAHPEGSGHGKVAHSEFKVLSSYQSQYAYLEVKIHTGRTHQIRVHLNASGHSIVGDPLYQSNRRKQPFTCNRLFLHAYYLNFIGPDGIAYEFESDIDVYLKSKIQQISTQKQLFIVSGPSNAGKTTLINNFLDKHEKDFKVTTTYTTRPKREGAVTRDKVMVHVSKEDFENELSRNSFIEYAYVHGHYYGTHKASIEKALETHHVIANIDVQGARQLLDLYPQAHTIFVTVEDLEILRQRLIERGHESEEQIELRLKNAQKEIRSAYQYDTILINKQGGIEASTQAFADYIEQFIQE